MKWNSKLSLLGTVGGGLLLVALAALAPVARPHAHPELRATGEGFELSGEVTTIGLQFTPQADADRSILLCQAYGPAPCAGSCNPRIDGVDCRTGNGCGEQHWNAWGPIPWQAFEHGEYIGPARPAHVPEYHLRVDDVLEFVFVLTREEAGTYRLQVGDSIKLESQIDTNLTRELNVLPDGTVTLPLLGQVKISGLTLAEVQKLVEERYKKYYKVTDFTITATKYNTRLDDLRAAVDSRFFSGGQGRTVRVNPEGTISLPQIGQVPAQGLTLDEIRREVNERYAQVVEGLDVTPNLSQRAPRYIYVVGEVKSPGRFSLEGPTTAMQAVALAGSWNNGGNLRQMIVFRRGEDWRLLATRLDLQGALYGKRPNPADEIWLRDSDVVLIPKSAVKRTDDIIELVFTNGIYRVFPITFNYGFGSASNIVSTAAGT